MTKFDKLNKDLKDFGFKIDGDVYTFDKITYQTINVNGQIYRQPEHRVIKMMYIGEGCEIDDSDEPKEGTEFYEFCIMNGDRFVDTICISDINELKDFING